MIKDIQDITNNTRFMVLSNQKFQEHFAALSYGTLQ